MDLLRKLILKPDSVIVKGPVSHLKSRKEIKTNAIPLGLLDSRTSTEVNLEKITGFEYST